MSWLIGTNPHVLDLEKKLWSFDNLLPNKNLESFVLHRKSVYLAPQECLKLHSLTYLNEDFPFGKVDTFSNVGMVSKCPDYCHRFNKQILEASKIIANVPEIFVLIQGIIKCFVPLADVGQRQILRADGSGKSCHWLKGAVFLSLPFNNNPHSALELSLNIVHELGHQVLMVYQESDEIMNDYFKPVYSSVRKTERPAILSFHALVAVYFMLYYFQGLLASDKTRWTSNELHYLHKKASQLKSNFVSGVYALRNVEFTLLGYKLLNEMIENCKGSRKISVA